jgi:ABC-type transport system involved in multi-copper enzyme maturation permease subunit
MSGAWRGKSRDQIRLLSLSARTIAGRRFWIAPLLPLSWIAFQILRVLAGLRPTAYAPADAQTLLIGLPLTLLGIGFGVRIIAGDIDRRTLEIAYTVPGGTHRVWIPKLVAGMALLLASLGLLALATFVFCTSFPWGALYGALQAAVFYMVLSMALSALFRNEPAGALLTVAALAINLPLQEADLPISPFWNPLRPSLLAFDPSDVLAWTAQNRVGFLIAIVGIAALAFGRAEQRERLLGA